MSYWQTLDMRYLGRPEDWDAIFGRSAPLIIEIGFGRANHLIHLGKLHPDKNIIGVEVSRPSLRKASQKVKTQRLANVRVVDGSGPALLWQHVAVHSIAELHINFPDPWHKEGHHQRRLINPQFLHLAATRMLPDAKLFIATDHPSYQPVVTECLEATPYFDSRLDTTYTTVDSERFQTKYEEKALREGRVPFYYKWVRNATAAPNEFEILEELPMPHAIVALPMTIGEIRDRFEPFQVVEKDGLMVAGFKQVFESAEYATLLIETYIKQAPQDQRVGLLIVQREPHQYIIKLHDIGFPRATDGVHFAVGQLADWLIGLHPEGRVVNHTLQRFQTS